MDPASPGEDYARRMGTMEAQADRTLLELRRAELAPIKDPDAEGGLANLYSSAMLNTTLRMCDLLLRSCAGSLRRIAAARDACAAARRLVADAAAGEEAWARADAGLSGQVAELRAWDAAQEAVMRDAAAAHPLLAPDKAGGDGAGGDGAGVDYEAGRLSPAEHDALAAEHGLRRVATVQGTAHYAYDPPRTSAPVDWAAFLPSEIPPPREWPNELLYVRPSSLAPWADRILRPEAQPELWPAKMRRDLRVFWDAYVRYLHSQVQVKPYLHSQVRVKPYTLVGRSSALPP